MIKLRVIVCAFLLVNFYAVNFLYSLEISGTEVMKKVYDESNKNKNKTSDIELIISDSNNNKRVRLFNLKSKISNDINKTMIMFYEPVNIKGTALLTHTDNNNNDSSSQWIYFPAFKSLKVISGDEKNKSFMGSDFSYSDIGGRTLEQDTHSLVKEDENYYYVRSIPKDSSDIYAKMDSIIDKSNNTAAKITFYNKDNKVLKILLNTQISKINGAYEIIESIMKNEQTSGQTVMKRRNVDVKTIIKEDEVNVKALQIIS